MTLVCPWSRGLALGHLYSGSESLSRIFDRGVLLKFFFSTLCLLPPLSSHQAKDKDQRPFRGSSSEHTCHVSTLHTQRPPSPRRGDRASVPALLTWGDGRRRRRHWSPPSLPRALVTSSVLLNPVFEEPLLQTPALLLAVQAGPVTQTSSR